MKHDVLLSVGLRSDRRSVRANDSERYAVTDPLDAPTSAQHQYNSLESPPEVVLSPLFPVH
jgi:hypothetical protein